MSEPITHHPDGTTLLGFAAATLAEPLAAVVACHLSMCPQCRQDVADLEMMGGVLMASAVVPPASQASGTRRRIPAASATKPLAPARRADVLPMPLVSAYDLTFDRVPWRRLGPGVWHHRLTLRQESDGDLRLLRISAGRRMPDHGHGGSELTLMLEGSYSDGTGVYRRGDVQDVDHDVEHQPMVGDDADCVCLIASDHPARFKSLLARIAQPWTGL
jgi:putative transcriptional regulator